VVGDDEDTLVACGNVLSKMGVDAVPAPTRAAARDAVMELGGVHAAIIDQTLPDGDGLELARDIRRAFGSRIAIASGEPEPDAGLPAGVDAWLLKPVKPQELWDAIEALLRSP
jgi:DNA-binding response OmpR family regulator